MIEFDPPGEPELRAKIERLDDTDDGERDAPDRSRVHVEGRSLRVRSR
jgi:hypothetical protein